MKSIALALGLVSLVPLLRANGLPAGTYVKRPDKNKVQMTLTVEAAGSCRKLTCKIVAPGQPVMTLAITSRLDGKDAPVLVDGKASGETMASHDR